MKNHDAASAEPLNEIRERKIIKDELLERRLKKYDRIHELDLFSDAQLDNFHRKLMSKIDEIAPLELAPKEKPKPFVRPFNTEAESWRSSWQKTWGQAWLDENTKSMKSLPIVPVIGFLLMNIPITVRAQFQKFSDSSGFNSKFWS